MSGDTTGAAGIVSDKFHAAQNYAQDAWAAAEAFLGQLGRLARLEYPSALIADPPEAPDFPDMPAAPAFEGVFLETPEPPQAPSLGGFSLERLELPEFALAVPRIDLPEAPGFLWPEAPGEAPEMAVVEPPAEPVLDLPEPPVFDAVDIPAMPSPIRPTFEGQRPPVPPLLPPGNLFAHEEAAYASPVREALTARLLGDLEGTVGGLSAADQARFENGRDLLVEELNRRLAEIEAQFAARNCSRPSGPMLAMIRQVQADHARKLAELDRELLAKAADLAREDGRFAVDKALALESLETERFNRSAERAFERASAVARFGYEALNAEVNAHNAQLAAYQADAAVYEARIRAEVAELEKYRTRMQGASLAAEIQGRAVELYKARLEGVAALVETYKARMQGAAIKAETQKQRLMAFETKTQAYAAAINANTAGLNAHAARLAGEETKARVYGEQVKALTTAADLRLREAVEENRLKLEKYQAELAGYEARGRLAAAAAEALLKAGDGELRAFEVQVGARNAEVDARSKEYAARMEAYLKSAEVSLKEADLLAQNSLNEMRLEAEKIRSGAQISAQMAASALNSVNASAQIGYAESKGERVNSSVTESTQRSTSETTSTSTGFRESISHNYNYKV